jgi:hypothetical protein
MPATIMEAITTKPTPLDKKRMMANDTSKTALQFPLQLAPLQPKSIVVLTAPEPLPHWWVPVFSLPVQKLSVLSAGHWDVGAGGFAAGPPPPPPLIGIAQLAPLDRGSNSSSAKIAKNFVSLCFIKRIF